MRPEARRYASKGGALVVLHDGDGITVTEWDGSEIDIESHKGYTEDPLFLDEKQVAVLMGVLRRWLEARQREGV